MINEKIDFPSFSLAIQAHKVFTHIAVSISVFQSHPSYSSLLRQPQEANPMSFSYHYIDSIFINNNNNNKKCHDIACI